MWITANSHPWDCSLASTRMEGKEVQGWVLAASGRGALFLNTITPCWEFLLSDKEKVWERKKGEGRGREDGQRLPHRAWSSDCEKRLFFFFTLPSEEPSDRRGILSLSPLGLEEAAEGYFPRSEAKKGVGVGMELAEEKGMKCTERGDRGRCWRVCRVFVGSSMWSTLEGRNDPEQQKKNTKQQQNTNTAPCSNPPVPPFHTVISTTKTVAPASEMPPGSWSETRGTSLGERNEACNVFFFFFFPFAALMS